MCCEHDQPRPMSRAEVEMRARWQREREEQIARRFYASPGVQDYMRAQIYAALRAQAGVIQEVKAEWVGQDTLPGLVINQPTPVAQPAEVAKELVLA